MNWKGIIKDARTKSTKNNSSCSALDEKVSAFNYRSNLFIWTATSRCTYCSTIFQ
jgi:hypothetical protein